MSASSGSLWSKLLAKPRKFRFDAALRVLMHAARRADPAEAASFHASPALTFSPAEISAVAAPASSRRPRLTVALIGLVGPSGVLPRLYGEMAGMSVRGGSAALSDFLDMLAQRMVAFFGRAGIKYRLERSAETAELAGPTAQDPVRQGLLPLVGYGTPGLVERLGTEVDPLLHYAGLFAMRPRSADRLAALVSDWLGLPVEVEQFAGSWLELPVEQRTALPTGHLAGAWNQLGVDAAIGVRSWDLHARIVLRIGPLDHVAFDALLPDRPGHQKLVALVRAFLGFETGFAINLVLRASEVLPLRLPAEAAPAASMVARLGWNTWIEGPRGAGSRRMVDAADAQFEAEVEQSEREVQSAVQPPSMMMEVPVIKLEASLAR
jgi:type VI secretion system protein ImpH